MVILKLDYPEIIETEHHFGFLRLKISLERLTTSTTMDLMLFLAIKSKIGRKEELEMHHLTSPDFAARM